MTSSKKPYRVYRQPRRVRGDGTIQWGGDDANGSGGSGPGRPRRTMRFVRRALFVALAGLTVWLAIAFISFQRAVHDSNERLDPAARAALPPADGPALASSHVILLVGSDTSEHRRTNDGYTDGYGQADSLMLLRIDVPRRTVAMLSIPRDMEVEIPGHGSNKINAAYPAGGLPLAIRTVHTFTGVPINHVIEVDLDGFKELINGIGGITVDNPRDVFASEPFDGEQWRFPEGELELDGRNALAYARLRKAVQSEESDDRARAIRQQRVIDSVVNRITSLNSFVHPNGVPKAVVAPLKTDIAATQMLTFAFGRWWAPDKNVLHCRLSGDIIENENGSVIQSDERNPAVVRMFLGKQAPLPPEGNVGAGCILETERPAPVG